MALIFLLLSFFYEREHLLITVPYFACLFFSPHHLGAGIVNSVKLGNLSNMIAKGLRFIVSY